MRDSQGCCPDKNFRGVIEDLLTDQIIVIIKSGGPATPIFNELSTETQGTRCLAGCCKHEGKLCSIGSDFIQLLADEGEIIIPFNAIAAIIDEDN